jgi:hypothetical protein
MCAMLNAPLCEFIEAHRDELIGRCRVKVAKRPVPPPPQAAIDHGVVVFLDQVVMELRHGPSQTHEIDKSAIQHGHDLLDRGFNVSQVVHDYGDICQSITDLAVEQSAPISADDFRTLNRCLDNAIASAVTEHARERQVTRNERSQELRNLTDAAITAFEVLQSGRVEVAERTGAMVHGSLMSIRALIDRQLAEAARRRVTRQS